MNQALARICVGVFLISTICGSVLASPKQQANADSAIAPIVQETKQQATDIGNQITQALQSLSPEKRSALEQRLKEENLISTNEFGIAFYKPTYILPFYYTQKPYNEVYEGQTPDNQSLKPAEFKVQLSLKVATFHGILGNNSSFNIAYSQLMYWQFYAKSQYFRETNYEPELFLTKKILPVMWASLGVSHQSNGRGGETERSWNRVYINLQLASGNWMLNFKPWLLIFQAESSNLHNPNITRYMGHGELTLAYKWKQVTFSLMLRNTVLSGFRRGAEEFNISFPIYKSIKGYAQFFSGYGQSLIEYDHYTNSAGIGIALSDWI